MDLNRVRLYYSPRFVCTSTAEGFDHCVTLGVDLSVQQEYKLVRTLDLKKRHQCPLLLQVG